MQLAKHWAGQLDDYAIDLAWSPDGSQLAAASAAGPVSIFAAVDGAKQHELPGHADGTNCIAWQPAGQAAKASGQGTGSRRQETGDRGSVTGQANVSPVADPLSPASRPLSPATLATGGQDGAVKFWDTAAGQHIATAKLGSAWVEYLAWSAAVQETGDGRQATGPQANRDLSPVPGPLSPVVSPLSPVLLFAAAGRTLAAIRTDATITHTFKPAPKTITAIEARPGGGSIAAAYFGGVVLWDAEDFVVQKEFPYGNGIHALVWSPDNRWLVSGNQDPSVHLWIPDEDVELHMSGYEGKVKFLSFDHTSRWLATSGGREACIWDCAGAGPEGREPAMLPHDAPVCAVKFQNTHGLLATAAKDGVVQLWSPERRTPLRATVKMPSVATKLVWSPDDTLLAIGSEKGTVYVLKCEA